MLDLHLNGFSIYEKQLGREGETVYDFTLPGDASRNRQSVTAQLTPDQFENLRAFMAILISAKKLLKDGS